jgi:hypothetical protein
MILLGLEIPVMKVDRHAHAQDRSEGRNRLCDLEEDPL